MTDQIELMQSDLDHMREVLSSGQYSLDPSILAGVGLLPQALHFSVDTSSFFFKPYFGKSGSLTV